MIAITGYNGFVGQQLLNVVPSNECLLLGRKPPNEKQVGFSFCQFNLANANDNSLIQPLCSASVLIHIAARVHVMNETANDPLTEFREVNTEGTLALAKKAAEAGVKRFIFISSIKVNGESTKPGSPFKFDDERQPDDPYGISKSEAEVALLELGQQTGMEIVIIRPPLVYGEGVKANFAALIKLVGKGLPLPFRCITKNKRSMISVYNLVDLIKTCIEHPNAANRVFLASDDNDLSTAQMIALMAKVQGKKNLGLPVPVWCFKLAGKLLNKTEVFDRLTGSLQLDITHTKKTLNWTPPYPVEHGFKLAAKKPS